MANKLLKEVVNKQYPYGFVTEIESDTIRAGLNEDIVRLISAKKNEPEFMLEWRLKAYRHWLTLTAAKMGAFALSRQSIIKTLFIIPRQNRQKMVPKVWMKSIRNY